MNVTSARGNRADDLTALLTGAPDPGDHDLVRAYLKAACDAGLSLLLVKTGLKEPFDGRLAPQRTNDDKAHQKAAKAAGQRNWRDAKAPAGVHLATDSPMILDGYLDTYIKFFGPHCKVNLGVAAGASRIVIVDCDTLDQMAAFLADAGLHPDTQPTVRSPGAKNVEGQWVHSDGGHFWFTVPDGMDLPEGASYTDPEGGYAVIWGAKYVLIPPSVRPEGCYTMAGRVHVLADWLYERIVDRDKTRTERARKTAPDADDPVALWGASVTWAEILGGTDWIATGKCDACGCDTWTAPGAHASMKSATAHERGCSVWLDSPDPPLHIWTDHDIEPFEILESHTVTRLQAVALIDFDNDVAVAMEALKLHAAPVTLGATTGNKRVNRAMSGTAADDNRQIRITWADAIEPEPVQWLWVDITADNQPGDPFAHPGNDIACVNPEGTWVSPEVETDGRIACGMVSIAAGREGTGKSSFGIWLTAKITCGQLPGAHYGVPKRVFYLATEDSWQHTLAPRMIAAGADMSKVGRVEVIVQEGTEVTLSLPNDVELLTRSIIEHDVALVVIDPLMSTLGQGLNANASRDVRMALEPIKTMAEKTMASVVGIAHFNKATGLDALSRITGSGAFKDIARAVMVFVRTDDGGIFTQPKNSVGRNDLPSLNYEITPAVVETPKGKSSTGVFSFTGVADTSVDEVLADDRGRTRCSPVTEFLIDYITEHADIRSGEIDAGEVIEAGRAAGFKEKQLTDARSRATRPLISTRREGFGKEGRSIWKIEKTKR